MPSRLLLSLLLISTLVGTARAADPDLPDPARIIETLAALPEVRAARLFQHAELASRAALAAGSQEWQVRAGVAHRAVGGGTPAEQSAAYREWELAVERPLRSARKAEIDRRLGDAVVARADNALGDALHEAGRELLRRWSELGRGQARLAVLREQHGLWQRTLATVARRVELGDAARLDLDLSAAALADNQARLAEAEGRLATSRAEFDQAYPELAGSAPSGSCAPRPEDASLDDYFERVLADQHELAMAEAEAERRRQLAERAGADQHPDPVVGLRLASERGGAEHLAALTVTLPLGGEYRSATARALQAEAELARERVAQVRRRLQAEVAAQYARRLAQLRIWEASQGSAGRYAEAAARSERAYALGEAGLTELLSARRQEQEARLSLGVAAIDACEADQRLRLDTHTLWPLDAIAER